jgi:endonuclease-3
MRRPHDPLRARAGRIVRRLEAPYPDARCTLDFASPWHLLVATVLSAQCTDACVNRVTPALFARYPDAAALADADAAELGALIRPTGFYRTKAKHLIACCRLLVERHGGSVPRTMDELVPLPGVGRKTANVVLGMGHGLPGLAVDTHVGRLARRLGLTTHADPDKVERDLCRLVPPARRALFGMRLILHGRQVCHARRPDCAGCGLRRLCPRVGLAAGSPPLRGGRPAAERRAT